MPENNAPPAAPTTSITRLNQVKFMVRQKLDKLSDAIKIELTRGDDTTEAEAEFTRCIAWAHALNAGTAGPLPSTADDKALLHAMNELDKAAAQAANANDLLSAVTDLINAYKAP
jgi:hypothetical protein